MQFSVYDPISGDSISERKAFFMKGPDMAFGKTAPEAEFRRERGAESARLGAFLGPR